MDFELSPEQMQLREEVRQFAKTEAKSLSPEFEEKSLFPQELHFKIGRKKWLGPIVPSEYSGMGKGAIEYNYERSGHAMDATKVPEVVARNAAMAGTDAATYTRERPGMSAFAIEDGVVYHTYSTYARGLDGLWGMYQWLDRASLGRNETGVWWRRHDEYATR